MTQRDDAPPAERLAAFADGAEDGEVRAYLAAHPEANAEVEAMRAVINAVRASQPRPLEEPPWGRIAEGIARACDAQDARRGWLRRLLSTTPLASARAPGDGELGGGDWLRRLVPIALLGAGAGAALLWAAWPEATGRRGLAPDSVATSPTAGPTLEPMPLEAITVEGLRAAELDAVLAALGDEMAPDDDGEAWASALLEESQPLEEAWPQDDEMPYASDASVALLPEPDYVAVLDELSDSELDALLVELGA